MVNFYTIPKGKFIGFLKVLLLVLVMGSSVNSWGQVTVTYTAMTTIICPATPVATISTPPTGLTFSQISRGAGVTCGAAGGSISGSGFNNTLALSVSGSKWYTFSITSDASTPFTLNSLDIVSRVSSATGSPNVSVQYSIGAGAKTVIGSYTPTASAATYTFSSLSIAVGASSVLNIFIIPNTLTASTTTCRVENSTSATVTASASSSLSGVSAGAGTEPATLSSTVTALTGASAPQTDAVLNYDFLVTDDANTTSGNDALPTLISQIVIPQGTGNDIADWTQAIQGAELSDGTNTLTGTINATNITFSAINTATLGNVSDGGTKTYSLKVWLKTALGGTLPTTVDGLNLAFKIDRTNFTTASAATSTQFESGAGTVVESGSTNNAIDVVASKLNFVVQPSSVNQNATMSPSVTISANDPNNNRDLGYTANVLLSSTGTMTGDPIIVAAAAGLATYSSIVHTASGTGLTLSATSGALTATGNSSAFNVNALAPIISVTSQTHNSTYAYGNVALGTTLDQTFTINNTGSSIMTISSLTFGGAGFAIQGAAPTSVAIGGTQTFTVRFTPSSIGAFSGSVTINNNSSNQVAYVINFTGNGTPSSLSDIIFNSASAESNNSNIAYATYQSASILNTSSGANGSIGVMGFTVRDGGTSTPDADVLPTILSGISFNVTNVANIRSAALFNGSTLIASVAVSGVSPITFTGLSGANVTCADNSTLDLNLRVSFNSAVTDNQKIVFTVATATAASASTSSLFAAANAGGAVSDNNAGNDINRIEVTADRLAFGSQPTTTSINAAMSPSVTVRGVDINANLDLDYVGSIDITSTGTLTASPVNATAVAGVATYGSLTHTVVGTGYILTATATGLASSNTIASNSFDISTIVYSNNDWRSLTNGTWTSVSGAGTATWEKYSTVTGWSPATGTSPTGTANVYINNDIQIPTAGGSYGGASIFIMSGKTLTWGSSSPWTAKNMMVYNGGSLQINTLFTMNSTGTFEVEDNANVYFNYGSYSGSSLSTTLWNGIENFHPNSNFYIQNQAGSATDYFIPANADISTNTYNSFTACFGNLIFNSTGTATYPIFGSSFTNNLTHKDFIFRSTTSSSNSVRISQFNLTTTIGGSLILESGFNRNVTFTTTTITGTFTINGNVENNSAKNLTINNSGTITLNVNGNIIGTNTGNIILSAAGTTTTNLKGDISVTANASLYSSVQSTLNFTGSGDGSTAALTQAIDIASTTANENQKITFNVNSGAYVQIQNQDFDLGSSSDFIVLNGGILDFGFNGTTPLLVKIVSGATGNKFNSQSGSTLKITSPDGISTIGNLGNVQSVATITYVQTAIFHYIGKVNQVTGNGITSSSGAKTIICDLIDNSKELAFTNSTSITSPGKLDIRTGKVIESTTAYISGSNGSLTMAAGTYYKIAKGNLNRTTSDGDIVPRLTGTFTLSGGTIELSGTGASDAYQTLRGTRTYANLSFTNGGFKYLSSPITGANYVKGTVLVSDATILNVENNTFGNASVLSGNATSLTMTGTSQYITGGTGDKPDALGTYTLAPTSTIEFTNTVGTQQDIKFAPIYANINISGTNVGLTNTTASLTLQSSTTFTVKNGGTFNVQNLNGFSGGAATAVGNTNTPTIALEANSTVNYNATANQVITTGAVSITPAASNYYNLRISGSGNKTAPSGNLIVAGDITGTGTAMYVHNNGTLVTNGTAAQNYTASTPFSLYKFVNNNASVSGLTINNNVTIEKEMTLGSASKINLTAGEVILKSDVNATAALTAVPNDATINYGAGRFNIQRYMPGVKAWRFLAAPVDIATSPTITDAWREGGTGLTSTGFGTRITGLGTTYGTGAKFDEYSPNPSMKVYSMPTNTFIGVTEADLIAGRKIANDEGYFLFVRGDRGVTTAAASGTPTTLQIKGQVRTGDQTYTVDGGSIGNYKFKSIGNPYPSRIDMRSVNFNAVTEGFNLWNPSGTGNYNVGQWETYVKSGADFIKIPGFTTSNTIESGQAFIVQNNTGSASNVVIPEASKTIGSANVSRVGVTEPTLEINLHTNDASGSDYVADGAMLNFDNAYINEIDNNDVRKVTNTYDNIGIKVGTQNLVVERRKTLVETDTIRLNISGMRTANYSFEFDPSVLSSTGLIGYLKDKYLQTETEISLSTTTNVAFTITSDAASKAADRFMIVFKGTAGTLPVRFIDIAATKNNDKTHTIKWTIANEINIARYEIERSDRGTSFVSIGNTAAVQSTSYSHVDAMPFANDNYYRVKAVSTTGEVQYSTIVKLTANVKSPLITVYPNPVVNKTIQLQLANQAKGIYTVQMVNKLGQSIYSTTIAINSTVQNTAIELGTALSTGNYTLVIISPNGDKTTNNIFVE